MDAERQRRLAENEALVRDVNELVQEVSEGWFEAGELVEFRCECANGSCTERVRITPREYESVRADGRRFIVVTGHELLEVERVVDQLREYSIVVKIGHGEQIAEARDPRA